MVIEQHEFRIPAHDHLHGLAVFHRTAVPEFDLGLVGGLYIRFLGAALHGTADVERAHGQLGAGLADRLGGDDTHRLAHVDAGAARQVAAIAGAADTVRSLARQHRADNHRLDLQLLDHLGRLFVDQMTSLDDSFSGFGIDDVAGAAAPQSPFADGHQHLSAFDHRSYGQSLFRATVVLPDDAVLSDIDQAAGKVARVRRLQGRIRQTLAGAVGGVEVFQDGQPLLEVGDDRGFDDLARGLGHQAAHAG